MFLPSGPTTPRWQRHQAITPSRFGLIPFRSPLLRESLLLLFPRVTEMFQFTRFPLPALCVQTGVTPHYRCRVSPFGHPRIKAWSTAPRGFSQPPTSFFGSRRQGIHRWLFVAWNIISYNEDARARYAVLKQQDVDPSVLLGPKKKKETRQRGGRTFKTEERTGGRSETSSGRQLLKPEGLNGRFHQVVAERTSTSVSTGNLHDLDHQLTILAWKRLLRKEVIQPHLPVRLPCYDFTPIANPTFDSSFP